MLLLNFAHPFTDEQVTQLARLLGDVPPIRTIATHVDRQQPLTEVAHTLADAAQLSSMEWQTLPLIINPPGLAPLAATLMAEIHGRSGHFPALINIRPVADSTPVRYEIAEIVNLQTHRDTVRSRR